MTDLPAGVTQEMVEAAYDAFLWKGDLTISERLFNALTAALAGRVVVPGWQPIETAPKDGTPVMLASTHARGTKEILEASWWSAERCAENDGGEPGDYAPDWYLIADEDDCFCRPTHWRSTLDRPTPAVTPGERHE